MPTQVKFVLKRTGVKDIFNEKKISVAINKAFLKGKVKADITAVNDVVSSYNGEPVDLRAITANVVSKLNEEVVTIEAIQEKVVETLTEMKYGLVAAAYNNYKKHRDAVRASTRVVKDVDLNKKMLVMKKSGIEEEFSINKIESALQQGCQDVDEKDRLSIEEIKVIAEKVTRICASMNRAIDTVEIKDIINEVLFDIKPALAKAMIEYGQKKASKDSTLIERCRNIFNLTSEEIKQENSNKNHVINSTQRDYLAGEVNKALMMDDMEYGLPKDMLEAHKEGIAHQHDMDYIRHPMFNCCLINLEDMFQNGTVINNTKIDTPTSFKTACNLASQISLAVGSNQYGFLKIA